MGTTWRSTRSGPGRALSRRSTARTAAFRRGSRRPGSPLQRWRTSAPSSVPRTSTTAARPGMRRRSSTRSCSASRPSRRLTTRPVTASSYRPWGPIRTRLPSTPRTRSRASTRSSAWIDLEYSGPVPEAGTPTAPCGTNPAPPGACLPPQTPNAGWGIIARNGDTNSAGAPSWSHNLDGKTDYIAYTSTDKGTKDGRLDQGTGDVYVVPYNDKQGGTATPLAGASDPNFNEYYPAWSPDDKLIAFNRVAAGNSMYNQPLAEVYVVATSTVTCDGATAAQCRLKADESSRMFRFDEPRRAEHLAEVGALAQRGQRRDGGQRRVRRQSVLLRHLLVTRVPPPAPSRRAPAPSTPCAPARRRPTAPVERSCSWRPSSSTPRRGQSRRSPQSTCGTRTPRSNNLIPAWDYFPIPTGVAPPIP